MGKSNHLLFEEARYQYMGPWGDSELNRTWYQSDLLPLLYRYPEHLTICAHAYIWPGDGIEAPVLLGRDRVVVSPGVSIPHPAASVWIALERWKRVSEIVSTHTQARP